MSLNYNNPPYNYGVLTVAVDPLTPSTVYAGTDRSGLWKSTDAGKTWFKVDTGNNSALLDQQGGISTLAVDRFHAGTLYAAISKTSVGVLKSTDGGVNWTQVFANSPQAQQIGTSDVYSIALDPYTPGHLLAAFHSWWGSQQDTGLVESKDGGATWRIIQPQSGWGAGNAVWFVNNSNTWLVGTQGDGIWRTTNGGGAWTQVEGTSMSHGGVNALTVDPSGRLYLGLSNKIVASTDQGATWTDVSNGLPYAGYDAIADDGSTLYTSPSGPLGGNNTQDTGVFTMPVGGSSWTQMSGPTCAAGVCNGPAQAAYDPVDHIVYSANWLAGFWMLPLASLSPSSPGTSRCHLHYTSDSAGARPKRYTATPHRIESSLIGRDVTVTRSDAKPKAYKLMLGDHSKAEIP